MSARDENGIHVVDMDRHGFVAVVMALFEFRWWLVGAIALATVAAIGFWKLAPSTYRAEATFVPSSKILGDDDLAQLGALRSAASSLGVAMPGGRADPSLLFEGILKSRTMIYRALAARFPDSSGAEVVLLDALRVRGNSTDERRARGELLIRRKMLRISVDPRTGMTRVSVAAGDPVLAASLANFMVAQIDSLSRAAKVGYAGSQVSFISSRLVEVGNNLRDSEEILKQFRAGNRLTAASPDLLLEEARLEREVRLNEQLYLTLKSQLEVARIEEVKSLPMLVTIDRAAAPVFRESPRLGKTLLRSIVIFVGLAVLLVLVVDYARSVRGSDVVKRLRSGLSDDVSQVTRRRGH